MVFIVLSLNLPSTTTSPLAPFNSPPLQPFLPFPNIPNTASATFRPLPPDIPTSLIPRLQVGSTPFPHGTERMVPESGIGLREVGLRVMKGALAIMDISAYGEYVCHAGK